MLGHRVAVLLRLQGPSRLLRPTACNTSAKFAPIILHSARRAFATPGRPKGAVGEPSKPVKRAVKKAAASSGKSAATKKVASKKKTATKKKPVKKVLTEEQKARREKTAANRKVKTAAAKKKTQLADLKAAALEPPKIAPASAYLVFSKETRSGGGESLKGASPSDIKASLAKRTRETAAEWKNLSPADIEHYNHTARTAREASQAEYKRWVDSHTPAEIFAANRARASLRLKTKGTKTSARKWAPIKDERQVKQSVSSYVLFSTDRHSSGDFVNIKITDRSKLIAEEWKALSESEKSKYNRLAAQDKERYTEEYTATYGDAPPSPKVKKSSPSS
ncbi:Hypothetical protein R9X50_00195500 [Acrodontium crateriforme]|uniref:HMG box domain-containing protein n=1 Tax=Acrodontium crateriforme TaxID=150365 RepID=A0AAQ3R8L3_9PEZI|nr:Hypothetical protein R9X50_00195500 [Acrodontium crateriforme]